jgi:hypothetical protein
MPPGDRFVGSLSLVGIFFTVCIAPNDIIFSCMYCLLSLSQLSIFSAKKMTE